MNDGQNSGKLVIGLPKGRLYESTAELLKKSGIELTYADRNYKPTSNAPNLEFRVLKPRNIPKMVEEGLLDAGIVGLDLILDEDARVDIVKDLKTMPVHLVFAGNAPYLKPETLVVATEYEGIAKAYLDMKGHPYRIIKTYGSTECFVPEFAHAIIDHVQTGKSLIENKLMVFDTILTSTTQLIGYQGLTAEKKQMLSELEKKLEEGVKCTDLSYPGFLNEHQVKYCGWPGYSLLYKK